MDAEKLVVVGQGYVGLPIAMRAVEVGFDVVGFDTDAQRMSLLVGGHSYVEDVPRKMLADALTTGRYKPTADTATLSGFDFAIITVPTPLRETLPDLTYIEQAATTVGEHLRRGATVVLESTTYPGTTEELMVPLLEKASGLSADGDFHVGYSPERIDPGNKTWTFVNTPKVVSGIGEESLKHVQHLYERLVDSTVAVSTPREAELTKLLENTFRHVNIALVNELAIYARDLGINVWESIDAAATKPFGFMSFRPGPGVGGHCLPVDPSYLSWQVRRTLNRSFRFVELANDVNDHMPDYVVQRLMLSLNRRGMALRDQRILILGLSYKKNSSDLRESPSLRVVDLLVGLGAQVAVVEPFIPADCPVELPEIVELSKAELSRSAAVLLLTDHDQFDYELLDSHDGLVLDTKNRLGGRAEIL